MPPWLLQCPGHSLFAILPTFAGGLRQQHKLVSLCKAHNCRMFRLRLGSSLVITAVGGGTAVIPFLTGTSWTNNMAVGILHAVIGLLTLSLVQRPHLSEQLWRTECSPCCAVYAVWPASFIFLVSCTHLDQQSGPQKSLSLSQQSIGVIGMSKT